MERVASRAGLMFSLGAYWYQYEQRGATHEGFRDVLAHVEQVRGWCLAFPLVLVLLTTTHPFHTQVATQRLHSKKESKER